MASPNAGPITGSELIAAIQDTRTVLLTRPQVASLLAFTALTSPRPLSRLNARTGQEAFVLVQGGARVEFSSADLTTWLAGTASPESVPANRLPNDFSGRERLMLRQGTGTIGLDLDQVAYVRGLGGSLDGVSGDTGGAPTPTPTPAPTLGALSLSGAITNGTTSTGTITGATSGSSIASNVTGLSVNSGARTYSFDGSAIAGTTANGLVETLAGATNSPRSTPVTVASAAAAAPVPQNYDMIYYGDSRTENGVTATMTANGLASFLKTLGLPGWMSPESGNKLRSGQYANFGINGGTAGEAATDPRTGQNGAAGTAGKFYRGTFPDSGSLNKGYVQAAQHPAGIVVILLSTNGGANLTAIQTIINALTAAGKVVVLLNELPRGVLPDGGLNNDLGSGGAAWKAWSDTLLKFDYASGDPLSNPKVIAVNSFGAMVDPGSATFQNKRGWLIDGLHFTPYGARQIAKTVVAKLASVWPQWASLPAQITSPVSNGASIAADTPSSSHAPFITANPLFTPGTNGNVLGTFVSPPAGSNANVPQGWEVGTLAGTGLTVAPTKGAETDPDGYPAFRLDISGTVQSANNCNVRIRQTVTQAQANALIAGGNLSLTDKLRAMGMIAVSAGSQNLTTAQLRVTVWTDTNTKNLSTYSQETGSYAGLPIRYNGYAALDAQDGTWQRHVTEVMDLANPDMAAALGAITAIGANGITFDWYLTFAGAVGDPASATIRVSRSGIYRSAS